MIGPANRSCVLLGVVCAAGWAGEISGIVVDARGGEPLEREDRDLIWRPGTTRVLSTARPPILQPRILTGMRCAAMRADARVNKSFHVGRACFTLYAEAVNVLNRANCRVDSFNGYNTRTAQASVTLDKMFPVLPSAGIVIEWESSHRVN